MKKSRFTEEKIIGCWQSRNAAGNRRGLPQAQDQPRTFYKWKASFGGMDVSEARKLKTLETENARLKKLLAMPCSTTLC